MRIILYSITILAGAASLLIGPVTPWKAHAGTIEQACLQSDRSGTRTLCGCIQDVADITLSRSDQRKAAKFFDNPQRAQDVRMSDRRSDERFWDRYQEFGNAARAYCASS
ncbi:MAG: hypothetical protein QNI90_14780 [Dinoroseobacter sp.]|nr:hypothetical protein [Dinoroseobacter sp.]MDJ0994839.1 hypothetical protein [Dinoroseobacter sp.]